jgi:SAM-dependent methyltransferase
MARSTSTEERLRREIEHHRNLAAQNLEEMWGWESPAGRVRADRRARLFVTTARIGSGTRALELGCGTGVFTHRVIPAGASLVALDLSAELLARARARVLNSARFVRGNAEALPFPAGVFDVVYGCSVLHHLDVETALREVRRVLCPGGRLVFSEPNLLNPQVWLMFRCEALKSRFGVSPDEMAFTRAAITRVLRRLGFDRFTVRHFDFLHPSIPASLLSVVGPVAEGFERVPLLRAIAGSLLIYAER